MKDIDSKNTELINVLADHEPRNEQKPCRKLDKLLVISVVVSMGFHVGIFFLAPWMLPKPRDHRSAALEVWLTEKPASKKTENPQPKTVVTVSSKEHKRPREARFFAEQDQTAEKEQKALMDRHVAMESESVKPDRARPMNEATDQDTDSAMREEHDPNSTLPMTIDRFLNNKRRMAKTKDPLNIRPHFNSQTLPRGQSSDDVLNDVETGDKTTLNAWQWQHAPFFNRIKTRIAKVWAPDRQIRRFDPKGSLLGHKERVTVLSITIGRDGNVTRLSVIDGSGVAYLDDEALRTLKVSAPFPNPPKELFNDREEFSFSFAFHLSVNRGISFDFQWERE